MHELLIADVLEEAHLKAGHTEGTLGNMPRLVCVPLSLLAACAAASVASTAAA